MNYRKTITQSLLSLLALFAVSAYSQTTKPITVTPIPKVNSAYWGNSIDWKNESILKTAGANLSAYDTLSKSEYERSGSRISAIDYDSLYQEFYVMRNPGKAGNRISASVGPAYPYCGSFDKIDKTMFLGQGWNVNMGFDHFFGKGILGLGLLAGYTSFSVDQNAFQADMQRLATVYGVSSIGFIPSKGYEHMYLLVGPVLSLPIVKRLSLEFGAKVGLFRNDPAVLGATVGPYNGTIGGTNIPAGVNTILHGVNSTADRNNFGYNFNIGFMYALTDRWSLGAMANVFNTTTQYLVTDRVYNNAKVVDNFAQQFSRKQGAYTFGLAAAYKFKGDDKKIIPIVHNPPTCCVPVPEDGLSGQTYEFVDGNPGAAPVMLKWKSGCNADGETYTTRLYKSEAGSSTAQLLKEATNASSRELKLTPEDLKWSTPGTYYYTVHSNQKNQRGTCMSEVATVTFSHVKPRIDFVKDTVTIADKCNFVHKVYGGKLIPRYKRSIVDTTLICTQCVAAAGGDSEKAKEFMKFEYETEKIPAPADFKNYVSGFTTSNEFGDIQIKDPILDLKGGWKNKFRYLTFTYEIQQVCAKSGAGTVSRYLIFVNSKGTIFKIEPIK